MRSLVWFVKKYSQETKKYGSWLVTRLPLKRAMKTIMPLVNLFDAVLLMVDQIFTSPELNQIYQLAKQEKSKNKMINWHKTCLQVQLEPKQIEIAPDCISYFKLVEATIFEWTD